MRKVLEENKQFCAAGRMRRREAVTRQHKHNDGQRRFRRALHSLRHLDLAGADGSVLGCDLI